MSFAYGAGVGTSIGRLGDDAAIGRRGAGVGGARLRGVRHGGAAAEPEQPAEQRDHETPSTHAAQPTDGPAWRHRPAGYDARMTHEPADPAERGHDLDDATRTALGKLSEALEVVEDARGHLYGFHRLCGTADLTLGEAVEAFREAGHGGLRRPSRDRAGGAQHPRRVAGATRCVEEYDDGYYAAVPRLRGHGATTTWPADSATCSRPG